MHQAAQAAILTINCGSSSLKFALFTTTANTDLLVTAHIQHIGTAASHWKIKDGNGEIIAEEELSAGDMSSAAAHLVEWLKRSADRFSVKAIGHRVVQGGMRHVHPEPVNEALIGSLKTLIPLAPEHLPSALAVIGIFQRSFPGTLQVACFDTAFHRQMPFEAQHYALPRDLWKEGLIRYGFHGLSYEYIVQSLQEKDPAMVNKKIIIAHLGNGASMAAVKNGKSIDTTMGLTPTGGLVMSTRSGDLDPGVVIFLLKEKKMTAGQVNLLLNERSGLKAISGTDGDLQHLLQKEATDERAAAAISMFCYHARKFIGALAAISGGIDMLVFTGGIGEHAGSIRQRICDGLEFMGIRADKELNQAQQEIISAKDSAVTIRVIPANEEKMIARHTREWMEKNNR